MFIVCFFKIAICLDFPVVKNSPAKVGDIRYTGLVPGSGRSPGGGNGNPLQYSCLEHPMDREAQLAMVHGVAESDMNEVTFSLFWGKIHWVDCLTFPIVFSQTPQNQHMQYWIYDLFPNLQVFSIPSLSKGHYHLHSGPT